MWMQISSGRGPEECCFAVGLFLKMFIKEYSRLGESAEIINAIPGVYPDTFRSILLSLKGDGIFPLIKEFEGTILWIAKSPIRKNHKRKNWFIDVDIFSETENVGFSEKDVTVESMRSSGPGGQNVNKVESAVRVVHIPTGLAVTAREERSQYLNKKLAFAKLTKLLQTQNEEKKNGMKKDLWYQHNNLERGNATKVFEGMKFKLRSEDDVLEG